MPAPVSKMEVAPELTMNGQATFLSDSGQSMKASAHMKTRSPIDRPSLGLCSSGALVIDRRFLYAQAAAAEGDDAAAAELLEQTLELAPDWPPLWFALAIAREKLGLREQAVAAFTQAAALDRAGALGADLHLARLGATPTPASASESYVRGLFDQYAPRFDAHLVDKLAYRAPALLADALARLGARHFDQVIDLGCGTGLCGAAFRASSDRLAGVDLSPQMIEIARGKDIYDRLEVGAIENFLARGPAQSACLILAADVFVYIGDLGPVFAAASNTLEPKGFLAFTSQRTSDDNYKIGSDLRFSHSEAYVRSVAHDSGLRIALIEPVSTRKDAGIDVPGLVVVATRA
jgi:predicted TPR repeat methyltransferase